MIHQVSTVHVLHDKVQAVLPPQRQGKQDRIQTLHCFTPKTKQNNKRVGQKRFRSATALQSALNARCRSRSILPATLNHDKVTLKKKARRSSLMGGGKRWPQTDVSLNRLCGALLLPEGPWQRRPDPVLLCLPALLPAPAAKTTFQLLCVITQNHPELPWNRPWSVGTILSCA